MGIRDISGSRGARGPTRPAATTTASTPRAAAVKTPSAPTPLRSQPASIATSGATSGMAERLRAILQDTPEVDLERVHRLRERIASGEYREDPEAVARGLLAEVLLGAGEAGDDGPPTGSKPS